MRKQTAGLDRPADVQEFHGLGAAFYPEHHPRETWPEYAGLMARAGIKFVRIMEFAWDKLEPREGVFDFEWLDDALNLLKRKGIRAIMCTPTAVPPLWACEKYPELHPVLEDGRTFGFGVRRYTCPTSIAYRKLSERIAGAMADHYGRDPQILAWQLDNEFGHPFCFCGCCRRHFQEWCGSKFKTIAAFNDALCMHFWGLTIPEFGKIPFPDTCTNPSLWHVYHRFVSDVTIDCYGVQIDALRGHGAVQPITTNMMGTWYGYDHEELGRRLDVIACDHYGLGAEHLFGDDFTNEMFYHAYMRGIRHGRNIWFHEFQCAHTGPDGAMPLPGQVRWEVLTQIGRGADLISFFRFDTPPSGAERNGYGLVGVHRRPGRVFDEVARTSMEIEKLRPLIEGSTAPHAEVAVLFTFDNHCEFARNVHNPEFKGPFGNQYAVHLAKHYHSIARQNILCDIVYPGDDFGRYGAVIVPALYSVSSELGRKLGSFVSKGGTIVVTSFSGIVDDNGRTLDAPPPGPLCGACGIEVRDYGAYHPRAGKLRMVPADPSWAMPALEDVRWVDEIRPGSKNVEVLAKFANPFYDGIPAITRNRYGKGRAYYLGAILGQDGYDKFYAALAAAEAWRPSMELPPGIFATVREKDGRKIFFVNNPHPDGRDVELPGAFTDLMSGRKAEGTIKMKPFDVRIFAETGRPDRRPAKRTNIQELKGKVLR